MVRRAADEPISIVSWPRPWKSLVPLAGTTCAYAGVGVAPDTCTQASPPTQWTRTVNEVDRTANVAWSPVTEVMRSAGPPERPLVVLGATVVAVTRWIVVGVTRWAVVGGVVAPRAAGWAVVGVVLGWVPAAAGSGLLV